MADIAMRMEDIVLIIQDFLTEQGMLETSRMLEKESMVARDTLGHDLTALRSLVLDGQWPEVEDVLRPLHSQSEVDTAGMLLEIRRQRFLELFEGTDAQSVPPVMDLVEALRAIEPLCSRAEFNRLCYCLTLDSLQEHPQYSDWTAAKGRLDCFLSLQAGLARLFQADIDAAAATSSAPVPGRLLELLARAGSAAVAEAQSARLGAREEDDHEEDCIVFDPVTDSAVTLSELESRQLASPDAINAASVVRASKRRDQREHRRRAAGAAPSDDIRASFGALRRTLRGEGTNTPQDRRSGRHEGEDDPAAKVRDDFGGRASLLRSSAGWARQAESRPAQEAAPAREGTTYDLSDKVLETDTAAAEAGQTFSPGRAAKGESGGLGGRSSLTGEEVSAVRALLGRSIGVAEATGLFAASHGVDEEAEEEEEADRDAGSDDAWHTVGAIPGKEQEAADDEGYDDGADDDAIGGADFAMQARRRQTANSPQQASHFGPAAV